MTSGAFHIFSRVRQRQFELASRARARARLGQMAQRHEGHADTEALNPQIEHGMDAAPSPALALAGHAVGAFELARISELKARPFIEGELGIAEMVPPPGEGFDDFGGIMRQDDCGTGLTHLFRDMHGGRRPLQAKPNKPVHPKHRRRQPWKKPVVCIECGSRAREVGGNRIYPHRPDLFAKRFWLCECGAYCGCHPQSNHPLGYPAGYDTRKARNRAHDAFDPLWRGKTARFSRRSKAYAWLAARMGISVDNCHIGMMTAEQARQVVRHVDELLEVHPAIAQGSKG